MNLSDGLGDDALEVGAEGELDLARRARRSRPTFLGGDAAELVETRADERVATAQVVVEEVQRLVAGDGGEPEGKFGQFHGERIQVHAVDAGFDDAPPPIGDLGFFLRLAFDELRLKLRGWVINDVVGQKRGRFDEEMA